MKISVLVPVYKVERYIERCARSLFEQTLNEIEYIFVDDCSPDNSMAILKRVINEYPNRKPGIKIVRHPQNRGSAAARNTGMNIATAQYTIHCDSDDWIEPDMYEKMYDTAIREDADMVHCAAWREEAKGGVLDTQYTVPATGQEMLEDPRRPWTHTYLWNKLIRKSLFTDNGIAWNPGLNMWEDGSVLLPLYLFARKMAWIDRPLYHYNCTNSSSISSFLGTKRNTVEEWIENVKQVERFYRAHGAEEQFTEVLRYIKWQSKSPLLYSSGIRDVEAWKNTFPEAHAGLWKSGLPLRHKILYGIAMKAPDFLVVPVMKLYDVWMSIAG